MVPSKSKPRRHRVLLQHTAPYPILIPWLRLPSVPADASTATIDGIPPCRPALRGEGPVPRIADRAPRCRTRRRDRPPVHPDDRAAVAVPFRRAPPAGRPEPGGCRMRLAMPSSLHDTDTAASAAREIGRAHV